eukprot:1154183-Pelagomonas_calceolata.AAC.2
MKGIHGASALGIPISSIDAGSANPKLALFSGSVLLFASPLFSPQLLFPNGSLLTFPSQPNTDKLYYSFKSSAKIKAHIPLLSKSKHIFLPASEQNLAGSSLWAAAPQGKAVIKAKALGLHNTICPPPTKLHLN